MPASMQGAGILKIFRRCDDCGVRCSLAVDTGDMRLLKCPKCGKEYKFYQDTSKASFLREEYQYG